MSQHRLDKLADFLDEARFLDRAGATFDLRDVQYTSPTDAVAELLDFGTPPDDSGGSVIATTQDNWAHASPLFIMVVVVALRPAAGELCRPRAGLAEPPPARWGV